MPSVLGKGGGKLAVSHHSTSSVPSVLEGEGGYALESVCISLLPVHGFSCATSMRHADLLLDGNFIQHACGCNTITLPGWIVMLHHAS